MLYCRPEIPFILFGTYVRPYVRTYDIKVLVVNRFVAVTNVHNSLSTIFKNKNNITRFKQQKEEKKKITKDLLFT